MTKRTLALISCLAFVAACPPDSDPEPTEPTDPPPSCATITSSFPSDGATNVYYRVTLTWEFDERDDTASATLTGPDGEVSGTGEWVGNTYIWTPSDPLAPSTDYTATLSYCDGANTPSTSFTTSAVGTPVNEGDIDSATYLLDVGANSNAIFIEPPGVGPILQQQLSDNGLDILIGVVSVGGGNITFRGALGDGSSPPQQDMCLPSIEMPQASFSENPFFEIEADSLAFTISGVTFSLNDLVVNGAFAPDGSLIAGATLAGMMDTRELVPLVSPDGGDDAVCEIAAPFGVVCEPCPDGGEYCLSALITNISASKVDGLVLQQVAEADIPDPCP